MGYQGESKLSSTPQWKYILQKQRGIETQKNPDFYYTGEVLDIPDKEFEEKDGDIRWLGNYPKELRGKKFRVMGIGSPDRSTLAWLATQKKKETFYVNEDTGPKEKIQSDHWKSGHWKVAKIILRRDLDRADNHWMRTGSKSAYRQYKLIEQFLEEKSQQNWDPDDDFATKYLTEYRRAFSDSMNTTVDWTRRREAIATIELVRSELKLPQYNKL